MVKKSGFNRLRHTNVKQDSAIVFLVDDVVVEDLVVECLGSSNSSWHDEYSGEDVIEWWKRRITGGSTKISLCGW
jgi:hypothetical protein